MLPVVNLRSGKKIGVGVNSMDWFLAKNPALGRIVMPSLEKHRCLGAIDRAWISETLRPQATANKKAVLLLISSKDSL